MMKYVIWAICSLKATLEKNIVNKLNVISNIASNSILLKLLLLLKPKLLTFFFYYHFFRIWHDSPVYIRQV